MNKKVISVVMLSGLQFTQLCFASVSNLPAVTVRHDKVEVTLLSKGHADAHRMNDLNDESVAQKKQHKQSQVNLNASGDADGKKAAASNTEAKKAFASPFDVTVNPVTGTASASITLPNVSAFSASSPSMSYDSGFDLSYFGGDGRLLGLPKHMFFSDIPFILQKENRYVLYIKGAGTYYNPNYSSISTDGKTLIKSNLVYGASALYKLDKIAGDLHIYNAEKDAFTTVNYHWVIRYKTGQHIYFSDKGLAVAVTDDRYVDNQKYNQYHSLQYIYASQVKNPLYNKLVGIKDALGEIQLSCDHNNINIHYLKNASGDAYQAQLKLNYDGSLHSFANTVGKEYSAVNAASEVYNHVIFKYDPNYDNLLQQVTQGVSQGLSGNATTWLKAITINYEDGSRIGSPVPIVNKVTHESLLDAKEQNTLTYQYHGAYNNGLKFGEDTMMEDPTGEPDKVMYSRTVIDGDLQTVKRYNYLSNAIETLTRSCNSGGSCDLLSKQRLIYPAPVSYGSRKVLPSDFRLPITTETITYNKASQPVFYQLQQKAYNDYNQTTSSKVYAPTACTSDDCIANKTGELIYEESTVYDSDNHLLPQRKTVKDYLATNDGAQMVRVLQTDYTNADGLLVRKEEKSGFGSSDLTTDRTIGYQYSTLNHYCSAEGIPTDQSLNISTHDYVKAPGLLCQETIQADNKSLTYYSFYLQQAHASQYPDIITYSSSPYSDKYVFGSIKTDGFNNSVLNEVKPSGLMTTMQYDVSGRKLRETKPNGLSNRWYYDDRQNTIIQIDSVGNAQKRYLDTAGHVIKTEMLNKAVQNPITAGAGSWSLISAISYDYQIGQPVLSQDRFGNDTVYSYDEFLRPAGQISYWGDHETGKIKNALHYAYNAVCGSVPGFDDSLCYMTQQASLNATTYQKSYSWLGKEIYRKSYANGQLKQKFAQSFDGLGHTLVQKSFYIGQSEDTAKVRKKVIDSYDAQGRLTKQSMTLADKPYSQVTYRYDDFSNQIMQAQLFDPANTSEVFFSSPITHFNIQGQATGVCYDKGKICKAYQYDEDGRLAQETDYNGNVTKYAYANQNDSDKGRLAGMPYKVEHYTPDNRLELSLSSRYDQHTGQISHLQYLSDHGIHGSIDYQYDFQGHVTQATYSGDMPSQTVTDEYDPATGLLVNHEINHNKIHYVYDMGRLTTLSNNYGDSVSLSYNDYSADNPLISGLSKSISYTASNPSTSITQQFSYDKEGREQQNQYLKDGNIYLTTENTYNAYDNIIQKNVSAADGTDDNVNNVTNYTYNALDQLMQSRVSIAKETQAQLTHQYRYDILGNMVEDISNHRDIEYGYDLSRLGQLKTELDKTNNITKTYAYDNNGNLTHINNALIYMYDSMNRLKTYVSEQGTQTDYAYDPSGQRIYKGNQTNGIYYYDGGELESSKSGDSTASYLGHFIRYYKDNGQIEKQLLLSTGRNSPADFNLNTGKSNSVFLDDYGLQIDLKTGNKLSANSHTQSTQASFALSDNPYQYGGAYYDSESGNYYMQSRYYSPELKQFISRDDRNLNRFAAFNGSPTMNIDPNGHDAISIASYSTSGLSILLGVCGILLTPETGGTSLALGMLNYGLDVTSALAGLSSTVLTGISMFRNGFNADVSSILFAVTAPLDLLNIARVTMITARLDKNIEILKVAYSEKYVRDPVAKIKKASRDNSEQFSTILEPEKNRYTTNISESNVDIKESKDSSSYANKEDSIPDNGEAVYNDAIARFDNREQWYLVVDNVHSLDMMAVRLAQKYMKLTIDEYRLNSPLIDIELKDLKAEYDILVSKKKVSNWLLRRKSRVFIVAINKFTASTYRVDHPSK
ncbi:RHS repeat-associated core domain-containing protein [Cysteiniphilum sp. 6C5]|uniref:RHS repeat domain-containing protein n=1 Tax=unclassified Cysteiniphilum TaxID=2610889 RepID=UPI003F870261